MLSMWRACYMKACWFGRNERGRIAYLHPHPLPLVCVCVPLGDTGDTPCESAGHCTGRPWPFSRHLEHVGWYSRFGCSRWYTRAVKLLKASVLLLRAYLDDPLGQREITSVYCLYCGFSQTSAATSACIRLLQKPSLYPSNRGLIWTSDSYTLVAGMSLIDPQKTCGLTWWVRISTFLNWMLSRIRR